MSDKQERYTSLVKLLIVLCHWEYHIIGARSHRDPD
jgi:hypothetical protein